jgi:tetratricopeptide (TPR) repeat protein
MSLSGNLKTMDLAELLQWVTLGRKTGSLTFVRNKTKNSIFFKDGKIISSKSNEPTRQLGHYLLFHGKINEAQLKRALEFQLQTRLALGKILVQEGLITQEEAEKALVGRTEEVIYDLFLWDEGYFHFSADSFNPDELILIDLDVSATIFEGVRRKDEWARIRAVFPSNNVVLALQPGLNLKRLALTPIQKKMLFLISQGKKISQIILELHGSDFQVNFELFQLYGMNVVDVKEVAETPPPPDDPAALLDRGQELLKAGKYSEATAVFQEVLQADPQNARADQLLEDAEAALCQELYQTSVPADKIPVFLVPEHEIMRFNLSHQEGFVASRINGACDVKSIVMLSPLRELEILQILDKLIGLGLIALK